MIATADPYIIQTAARHARSLAGTAGYGFDDFEDLRQEIVLDLLRRAPRFDATRGEWHAFVRALCRNRASELAIRQWRLPREVSLDAAMLEDGCSAVGFSQHHYFEEVAALNLGVDVRRVLGTLPARLRVLALLLGCMSIKEVCARSGKSRSSVYRMIPQIRKAFVSAGLAPRLRRPHKTPTLRASAAKGQTR